MYRITEFGPTAALIVAAPVFGQQQQTEGPNASGVEGSPTHEVAAPADRILRSIPDTDLRSLVSEALSRNSEIARALARAQRVSGHLLRLARNGPAAHAALCVHQS